MDRRRIRPPSQHNELLCYFRNYELRIKKKYLITLGKIGGNLYSVEIIKHSNGLVLLDFFEYNNKQKWVHTSEIIVHKEL